MRLITQPVNRLADETPIPRLPWLTERRIVFLVIGWLAAFSLGSVFISNPFASEASASQAPDYWRVMYLHGLLIGMVGLLALLACHVFRLRSKHARLWIAGGVLFATVVTAIGGIFDKRIPGAEGAMWTQIAGFFALDEILVTLLIAMVIEWRGRSNTARSLPFVAGWLAAGSMLVAALMGHLAGWILEFGNWPSVLGRYARARGMKLTDWSGTLVGSHSHDMAVAVMALIVSVAALHFGYRSLTGATRAVARVGLSMIAFGTVAMTAMYVAMGFTAWEPPTLFQSAGGTIGVAGDDILTGVLVMGGGLVVLAAYALVRMGRAAAMRRSVLKASVWSWVLSFATVVVTGYAIELNETYFGAGGKAPGAAKDAVFTWFHQDIGLFLFPAIVLLMLVADLFVARRYQNAIGWLTLGGTSLVFLGGMIFTFVDPALHGPGYVLSTAGLVVVGLAILSTMWWGLARSARGKPLTPVMEPAEAVAKTA